MRQETVSIIHQDPRILLGIKKQKLGRGRYNGFGGGIEQGETPLECAIRETWEETGKGIILLDPEFMGVILFKFESREQDHEVYFFRATEYKGDLRETDEMKPEWFDVNSIPYDKMWKADEYWLPLLLQKREFTGEFLYNDKHQIIRHRLKEVERI